MKGIENFASSLQQGSMFSRCCWHLFFNSASFHCIPWLLPGINGNDDMDSSPRVTSWVFRLPWGVAYVGSNINIYIICMIKQIILIEHWLVNTDLDAGSFHSDCIVAWSASLSCVATWQRGFLCSCLRCFHYTIIRWYNATFYCYTEEPTVNSHLKDKILAAEMKAWNSFLSFNARQAVRVFFVTGEMT